eukprot:CAMPEP_0114561302 /NCGR_PEP_ID=MMETSP0114-20121206/11931_1 /TAXON_ID=31324 /ORGANISM="Goniomonas sp, Strain m" /LENGTH=200 /DNA_ID=CAMNT_0001746927 /DNA_START=16 /DNA_END=618 /DNA_ORIENTATION=-
MGLEDQLFNLKYTAKTLQRESRKCEKEEAKEKAKLKKAIEKGNGDGARIYAANAIRQKNQGLNFLRLSSRIDAVASRLESAIRMNQVTKSMGSIVKTMASSLSAMNLEKISLTMDQFEQQFENLDVQADYVENAMAGSVSMSTPQDEVDLLVRQVADKHALDVDFMMPGAPTGVKAPAAAEPAVGEDDELMARLNQLKQS